MKISHGFRLLSLTALCLSAPPARAQGNLIVNGSFETAGGSLNGWTVNSTAGYFYAIGSATNYPYSNVTTVPDGNYFAYFANGPGGISQTLSTIPGTFYALSLSAIAFDGTNTASVSVNGSLLATLNFTQTVPISRNITGYNFNNIWDTFNFSFQATSANTTIAFNYAVQGEQVVHDGNADFYYGAGGIDNISVTQVVPEPSTLALLGMGLAGGLACRRRTRSKL